GRRKHEREHHRVLRPRPSGAASLAAPRQARGRGALRHHRRHRLGLGEGPQLELSGGPRPTRDEDRVNSPSEPSPEDSVAWSYFSRHTFCMRPKLKMLWCGTMFFKCGHTVK